MIEFSCSCGKRLRTKDENTGKAIACPGCGNRVLVPLKEVELTEEMGDDVVLEYTPDDEAEHDEDEREPATPRKSSSSLLFWIFSAVFLMCLCGVGSGIGWVGAMVFTAFSGPTDQQVVIGDQPAEKGILEMIPTDAAGFVSIRTADIWKGQAAGQVRTQAGDDTAKFIEEVQKNFGLHPQDFERLVIVLMEFPPAGDMDMMQPDALNNLPYWVVVQTSKPYDQTKILKEAGKGVNFTEKTYNGKTYHSGIDKTQTEINLYFEDQQQLVLANKTGITRYLDHNPAARASGPLQSAIALAKDKHFVMAGRLPADLRAEAKKQLSILGPFEQQVAALIEMETVYLTAHEVGDRIDLQFGVTYSDDAKATAAKQAADALLQQGKEMLAEMEKAPPDAGGMPPEILEMAKSTLSRINIQQQGRDLQVGTQVESRAVISLQQMIPQGPRFDDKFDGKLDGKFDDKFGPK